ncbi:MAG: hypothetical protein J6Y10_04515 [Lachnospiraceae bacterium]|nr:hypothetical protein [Lachnospiraceae bacterium]
MNGLQDEMELSHQEDTLRRWKEQSSQIKAIIIGALLFGGVATLFVDGKKGHIILWIVVLLAIGALIACDVRLCWMIAEGEKQVYNNTMELIHKKKNLEELGVINYRADFNREVMQMHIPADKASIPLPFYLIVVLIGIAFLAYYIFR